MVLPSQPFYSCTVENSICYGDDESKLKIRCNIFLRSVLLVTAGVKFFFIQLFIPKQYGEKKTPAEEKLQ
jgi:hypothetical protein